MKIKLLLFLLCASALYAQTGQCHSTTNNGASCTADAQCTGGTAPYCAVLKHVIFITKENRSFDSYFGRFPGVTGGPITTAPCVGTTGGCSGGTYTLQNADPTVPDNDCGHTNSNALQAIDNGLMDKFNQTCQGNNDWGKIYGPGTIPFYWSLATAYGLADHMFESMIGPSTPSHLFIVAATANEVSNNQGLTGSTSTCNAIHSTVAGWPAPAVHCTVTGGACTTDADCANTTAPYNNRCSNGSLYNPTTATNAQAIDTLSGTGTLFHPGVCNSHRTVSCTDLPTDTTCSSLTDSCDTTAALSGGRGLSCTNVTTIADVLDTASVSWKAYADTTNGGSSLLYYFWNGFASIQHIYNNATYWNAHVVPASQFATDAAACTSHTCTNVAGAVWITPSPGNSEHSSYAVRDGENWTKGLVNAVMNNSYLWDTSVIFITWDDWGGFYDHLAPLVDAQKYTKGIRVPLLCVGQYCKNAVNTTAYTFESLLQCVEANFGTGNLGRGDATAINTCANGGTFSMVDLSLSQPPLGSASAVIGAAALTKGVVLDKGVVTQ